MVFIPHGSGRILLHKKCYVSCFFQYFFIVVWHEPELQLRDMSGSMALSLPRSVLMSLVHNTAEGNAAAGGLEWHLRPC